MLITTLVVSFCKDREDSIKLFAPDFFFNFSTPVYKM